jgi:YEATS domain-containing protein 4
MAASVTAHCPISYGSIAYWLGRKADETATHRWTLFVRGPNGEDISYFVSKVVFKLHESFATPVREVTSFPFEVTENGGGEFETQIRIHFKDPLEESIEFTHTLKLYPPGNMPPVVKRPVVVERYDEIVFTNPSGEFLDQITRGPLRSVQNQVRHIRFQFIGMQFSAFKITSIAYYSKTY